MHATHSCTHAHAHAWRHTSTRHARPKYPCAPCHSRAQTRTCNQACLRLNIPMHEYIIIITLFHYLLFIIIFLLPRARPNVLIFCGCAPYLRVAHAAGNHSSSAMSPAACCPPRISRCIACHVSRQCVGQCEKAFSMRFEFVCTCVRMPSHACSMKRTGCLARQLGMAPHGKHGGPRARPHTRNERTHAHGMDCACRCVRIARLVRAVRDFGSAARRAAGSAFSSTRASRDAGPVFLNTTPHTKRLPSRRCGCRPLPKRLHSIRKTG